MEVAPGIGVASAQMAGRMTTIVLPTTSLLLMVFVVMMMEYLLLRNQLTPSIFATLAHLLLSKVEAMVLGHGVALVQTEGQIF